MEGLSWWWVWVGVLRFAFATTIGIRKRLLENTGHSTFHFLLKGGMCGCEKKVAVRGAFLLQKKNAVSATSYTTTTTKTKKNILHEREKKSGGSMVISTKRRAVGPPGQMVGPAIFLGPPRATCIGLAGKVIWRVASLPRLPLNRRSGR